MAIHASTFPDLRSWLRRHWAERQHRNAYYLMLNSITGAAAGLLFWFLLTRVGGLPASQIGLGGATVALGTLVAIIAKGGLDTAIVRTVPHASRAQAVRLLWIACIVGSWAAVILLSAMALLSVHSTIIPDATPTGWTLAGLIAVLLVITWLQDAYFLADGDARDSFRRNLVFNTARLLLPFFVLTLAIREPVPVSWAAALGLSAVAALFFARRLPARDGREVPLREFFVSAARNVSGSAAEFLPGLALTPLVLALDGPAAAGYWTIAWTAASLLFLGSAAICRSALAQMVRKGVPGQGIAIRKASRQHLYVIAPGAILGAALAPVALYLVGAEYAREAWHVLVVLCLSTFVVAPAYLYLAYLRAREHPLALVAFPLAMVVVLALLAPAFHARLGLLGVACAWFAANAPFGAYAVWKLRSAAREVIPHESARPVGRPAHVE